MRKLFFFLLFFPVLCVSQTIDNTKYYLEGDNLCDIIPLKDGKAYYSGVINIENITKDVLYSHAKIWFADIFKSAQNVIQLDDSNAGRVIGKGSVLLTNNNEYLKFTIAISVKDGRYKYDIYDLLMLTFKGMIPTMKEEAFEKYFEKCDCKKKKDNTMLTVINNNLNDLIKKLEIEMRKSTINQEDDW